jgi:hypothetical protein
MAQMSNWTFFYYTRCRTLPKSEKKCLISATVFSRHSIKKWQKFCGWRNFLRGYCRYIHMYIHFYTCILYIHIYKYNIYGFMYTSLMSKCDVKMYTVYEQVNVCTYVYVYLYTYIHIYIYIDTYIHTVHRFQLPPLPNLSLLDLEIFHFECT